MNKKLQLGITGLLVSTLLASNVIITCQAKADQTEYQKQISKQKQLLKSEVVKNKRELNHLQQTINNQTHTISNQNKTIQEKSSEIYNLKQQLQKATTRNDINTPKQITMKATAYISNCKGCSGLTYTEFDVSNTVYYEGYRIIAANFNILPLYSIVRIQTKTETFDAIVLDTGSAIRGSNVVDLLVSSYKEAIEFGRQDVKVTILKEGRNN